MSTEYEKKLMEKNRELLYIVEDDEGICELYEGAFEDLFDVRTFENGKTFFEALTENHPDLVILDIMLPDMDGYAILAGIRERDEKLPVIIISAKNDEMSFVKGLNKGADDYMSKPFSVMELIARVKANLRRTKLYISSYKDFKIDNANFNVRYHDRDLELTPKEFTLLQYLLVRAGTTVTREELFRTIWGDEVFVESRALDMHMASIRTKLKSAGGDEVIHTVRGLGYKID